MIVRVPKDASIPPIVAIVGQTIGRAFLLFSQMFEQLRRASSQGGVKA